MIVAVTANAGAEVRAACRDAGFAGVLAKPVVLEELIETVRRYMPATPELRRPRGSVVEARRKA